MGCGLCSRAQHRGFPQQPGLAVEQRQRALPWPLRGDRADLPQWDTDQPDQLGWLDAEKDFKGAVQAHGEAEERRLAYVAYTRAKHLLWVSSAAWVGSRAGLAEMSRFLAELGELAGRKAADVSGAGRSRSTRRPSDEDVPAGREPTDRGTSSRHLALRPP